MHHQIHQVVKKYDEALSQADTKKYKLSIQVSLDGFSFCILDADSNKFLSIESLSFEKVKRVNDFCVWLKEYHSENSWLKQEFNQVQILYESDKSTLIPGPLFEESEKENYSRFNFNIPDGHLVLHDQISILDAFHLYTVPQQIVNTVKELFPTSGLFCQSSALIESLLILNKNRPASKRSFANVRNSNVDIVITDGRKLLYYNAFPYRTTEDFIYYIMFVYEQLQLNPEEIELVLSGFIDRDSKLFDITYKYIRNVNFQHYTDSFQFSYVFNDVPAHYFFNLLNLNLCEL
jgi:hypothetical protein